jgi:hypothetical protein
LGIVDRAQQAVVVGRIGEQPEGRERDEEAVVHRPAAQPERARQRVGLALRQAVDRAEHGAHQLVQAGEGHLGLGLDPDCPQDRHAAGARDRVVEQRRLADPGLAAHHEDAAAGGARPFEERVQLSALHVSAVEHPPSISARGGAPHVFSGAPARARRRGRGRRRRPLR